MMRCPLVFGTLCCLLALLLNGCVSKPAQTPVYTLEPLPAGETVHQGSASGLILVMPVRLPPQLRQRGIVTEQQPGGPQMLVGQLWAGSLDEQIGAKLTADLQTLLSTPNVAQYPGPRFGTVRRQVETEISRFSGDAQSFTLRAVCTISDPEARRILSRSSFTRTVPVSGQGSSDYVAAATQVLHEFSREVAAILAGLSGAR